MRRTKLQLSCGMGGVALVSSTIVFGAVSEEIGLDALRDRLGDSCPTGAGVALAQIEAPQGSNYAPDPANADLLDITIHAQSGAFGSSSHATNVAQWMCGDSWSPAPGVGDLYCWELVDWCTNGFLQAQSTATQPNGTPYGIKQFNLSWIASFGSLTNDQRVLRRADFVVERDDVLMCSGVSNEGQDAFPLMMCMYNGLSVGVTDGEHVSDDTLDPYDGPVECDLNSLLHWVPRVQPWAWCPVVPRCWSRRLERMHHFRCRPNRRKWSRRARRSDQDDTR